MLENTFLHLPGFSEKRELYLWNHGILNWDEFISQFNGKTGYKRACEILEESKDALSKSDSEFFGTNIPPKDQWRCFNKFKAVYLDIETTGLRPDTDYATVIGLFDGKSHSFIHGINMEEFEKKITEYELVVTFNGSLFDLPFIRKKMPNVKIPPIHIDLRFMLQSLGISGGLKKIEEKFGFVRESDLVGLNGYDAVKLWRAYNTKKDKNALDKLVRYNIADIANLEKLLLWAYSEKRKKSGIDDF